MVTHQLHLDSEKQPPPSYRGSQDLHPDAGFTLSVVGLNQWDINPLNRSTIFNVETGPEIAMNRGANWKMLRNDSLKLRNGL